MALVSLKVQCKGINKSGLRCCKMIVKGTHCMLHSDQDPTAPPVLRCGGETIDGTRCPNLVHGGSFDQPTLCAVHKRAQKRRPVQLKFITCFGRETGGQRCKTSVPWKPPYFQFCIQHHDQAATFGSPVTSLPQELNSMIVAKLAPEDRLSFALANRNCANAVRGWGDTTRQRTMLRAHDLTYISSLTDEITGPFPQPMLLYTFANPNERTVVQLLNDNTDESNRPLIIAWFMREIHGITCKGVEFKLISKTLREGHTGDNIGDWDNFFAVTRLTKLRQRVAKAMERYPHFFPGSIPGCLFCRNYEPASPDPPSWMCSQCEQLEIFVPWCEKCSGPLPILALVRTIGEFYRSHLRRLEEDWP